MEFPSIYSSAKLAKSELLAAELAVSEVFRAHPLNIGDSDGLDADGIAELATLWGLPAPQPAPAPRRQRQRSLASTLKAARKAGADHAMVDGVKIALSPAAAVPEPTASEWDVVLQGGDHGEH
jgi:hypothetical protein